MHPTQRWRNAPLAFVMILLAGCRPGAATGPILSIDRLTHEFPPGSDWQPATEFVLSNAGGSPLKIEKIDWDCACTTANAGKNELVAGEKTTLRVQVKRPAIGDQKATISIYTNSNAEKPAVVELTCRANSNEPRIVSFNPRDLKLRNLDGEDAPEIEITALERAGERLIVNAESDLPFVAAAEMRNEEHPFSSGQYVSRTYRFVAALAEEHPFGRFNGKIIFRLQRQPTDKGPPEFIVPIQISAFPPLYADPSVLFATMSESGTVPELRVGIRRRSDKVTGKPTAATSNAEWLSVELQGAESDDVAADNRDPLKAGALTIRVVTAPPTGNARAEVTVIGDAPDLPKIVIPVVISGAQVASGAAGR